MTDVELALGLLLAGMGTLGTVLFKLSRNSPFAPLLIQGCDPDQIEEHTPREGTAARPLPHRQQANRLQTPGTNPQRGERHQSLSQNC